MALNHLVDLHSIFFSPSNFLICYLTWKCDFHCFGALGVGPGPRSHVLAWSMGSDYSVFIATEHSASKGLAIVFLKLQKTLKKCRPAASLEMCPTLVPQDSLLTASCHASLATTTKAPPLLFKFVKFTSSCSSNSSSSASLGETQPQPARLAQVDWLSLQACAAVAGCSVVDC